MDAGDWIALAAVALSAGAAGVSIHQAKSATASAAHARVQAEAAREANELARQQMAREEQLEQRAAAEADAAAFREAEKVELEFSGNGGGVVVSITNNGLYPITEVELLDVRADQDGPWVSWKVNPNIARGQLIRVKQSVLDPRRDMAVATWLLDDAGEQVRQMPQRCEALVRFRDHGGQWWHVTAGEHPPARVDPPTA
ncbi:hypothetical protein OG613_44625 (plasmid) [Streptomyces sp. NBC_00015]|uniref:hypothetical protein n=1 Tax=Streptomyces sp. NBC_00015 TaxID=2903611 RepID=UPI002F90D265